MHFNLSLPASCFIAKQRIDSAFFLFEAEKRMKEEKKENRLKKLQNFMELSDDDFVLFSIFLFIGEILLYTYMFVIYIYIHI